MALTIQGLIEYTNSEIDRWYENVKEEYGVIGFGNAKYDKENDQIVVEYTEDGNANTWSLPFYEEYLKTQKISWVFDCWTELA